MGCTTDYGLAGDYFVGVNSNNFASSFGSAVVGGQNNESCSTDSIVAGGEFNTITGSGSANLSFIGAGNQNAVTEVLDFVGAGTGNEVDGVASAVVAGGRAFEASQNSANGTSNDVTGLDSFVGTGDLNVVSGNGSFIGAGGSTYAFSGATAPGNQVSGNDAFIGAGNQNVVGGLQAFVGAGLQNVAAAEDSFIGGGGRNTIGQAASYSSIVGGDRNVATGTFASVFGGFENTASGAYAVVAGGNSDTAAGTLSLAGGYHADAAHNGSFVWSDYRNQSSAVSDSGINQFVVRASGGFYLYSNEATTSGVELAPGSGTWAMLSDRNAKTGIVPLDGASILAKVDALPISTWQYKSERGVRHVGPMAQDFYAAFGVGGDDRHITSIDEDGVALAAIKALHAENARLASENRQMRAKLTVVQAQVEAKDAAFEARLDAMAKLLHT